MSISTYAELKTAVASWLNRTDLTSVIPDFIAMAESDVRLDVRLQSMETLATGTLAGETLAHPTRFLEARRLIVNDYNYAYVTPERYQNWDDTAAHVYTSIGTNFYIMDATSGLDYSLLYYAGFAPFAVDADTNWLLTNHPEVYLTAACRYGADYLRDAERFQTFSARYAGAVARLTNQQAKSQRPGPLQVRAA